MDFLNEHSQVIQLTDEQKAITQLHSGRHAVISSAGTSKTTTAAARTHALISAGADPRRILVTTYGKEAADTLKRRIRRNDVQVGTIHHFGNAICNVARQQGLSTLTFRAHDNVERILYTRAMKNLTEKKGPLQQAIKRISEQEFFTYVEIQKGNLAYPDLQRANLNEEHLKYATQATSLNPAYLALYEEFERLRHEENVLTFTDMITHAWELLLRHPHLKSRVQGRYDHVTCDEYQDVNLAMKLLLDLIAERAVSTMFIGDDDQTIYSWRGSSTRFLQSYATSEGVQRWYLTQNFRSTGPITALAGAVIAQNKARLPKHLTLTRGLGGAVHLHSDDHQSDVFLREIRAALTRHEPRDIAVLIRRYGQTGPLEHMLLTEGIPYRVVGAAPFFERPEVRSVTAHLELAAFDYRRARGHVATPTELAEAERAMISAYARPSRFISRAQADEVIRQVKSSDTTLFSRAIAGIPGARNGALIARFANDLARITKHADRSDNADAMGLILELVNHNGYLEELRRESAIPELGDEKIESVIALAELAGRRSVLSFLDSLDALTQKELKASLPDPENIITFMTAFRAKGQEWPCVFIPDADSDTYRAALHDEDVSRSVKDAEEERRIFYVALSRAKDELHLLHEPSVNSKGQVVTLTPFLTEASAPEVLASVARTKATLRLPPESWNAKDAYALALAVHQHHFGYWIQEHWDGDGSAASATLHQLRAQLDSDLVKHELSDEVLGTWAFFGEEPSAAPISGYRELREHLEGTAPAAPQYRVHDIVHHETRGRGVITTMTNSSRGMLITVEFSGGVTQRYVADQVKLKHSSMLN